PAPARARSLLTPHPRPPGCSPAAPPGKRHLAQPNFPTGPRVEHVFEGAAQVRQSCRVSPRRAGDRRRRNNDEAHRRPDRPPPPSRPRPLGRIGPPPEGRIRRGGLGRVSRPEGRERVVVEPRLPDAPSDSHTRGNPRSLPRDRPTNLREAFGGARMGRREGGILPVEDSLDMVSRTIGRHVFTSLSCSSLAMSPHFCCTPRFVKFQRDLPSTAKYAELGALFALTALWMLRRHVKKRRYVERVAEWHRRKKRQLLRKYQNFVDRVAKTSSFLASLLPHLIYVMFVAGTKRMAPSLVTYLATRTYVCSIISFWHPLYSTFLVIRKLSCHLKSFGSTSKDDSVKSDEVGNGKTVTPSSLRRKQQQETELRSLKAEAVDWLKYWTVYAIILAIVRTGKLLPFIGHVLNVTTEEISQAKGSLSKKSGLYEKIRLPGKLVDEIALVFFIWLRFMPSSVLGDDVKDKTRKSSSSKKPTDRCSGFKPVDILYKRMSPTVISAMNSSAFLTKSLVQSSDEETFASNVIQKFKAFLDLFVLVRLISKQTQEWIITTTVESSALLPAVPTLMMPSYFTNYGVIYVSLIVPAGYSITSCDALRISGSNLESVLPEMDDASRYLQFWVVHAGATLLLGSFSPFLAWIPLSTHATWLFWAFIQLKSSTRKIYGLLESELGKKDLEDNIFVRSTRRIVGALPSDINDSAKVLQVENSTPVALHTKSKVA
ncbi:hypothetical protein ACHAWF_011287, partial [Thalassiosira exigua]